MGPAQGKQEFPGHPRVRMSRAITPDDVQPEPLLTRPRTHCDIASSKDPPTGRASLCFE